MEKYKVDRNKSKEHLEKYLMMYNIKEKDLIKNLADKLKLSEKFVKTLQFQLKYIIDYIFLIVCKLLVYYNILRL